MGPVLSTDTCDEETLSVGVTPSLVATGTMLAFSGVFSISFRLCSVTPPRLMLFLIGLGGAFDTDSSVDIFSTFTASEGAGMPSCWPVDIFLVDFWGAPSLIDAGFGFFVRVEGFGGGGGLLARSRLFAEPDDLVRTMETVELRSGGERLEKWLSPVGALVASTLCCSGGVC